MVTCTSCGAPDVAGGTEAVGASCSACGRPLLPTPDPLHDTAERGGGIAPPMPPPEPTVAMAVPVPVDRPVDGLEHTVVRPRRPAPLGPPPGWRPAAGPPPPVHAPPTGARYPLYADAVTPPAPPARAAAPPPVVAPAVAPPRPPDEPRSRRRRTVLAVVAAVTVVLLLAAGGALLLLGGPEDAPTAEDPATEPQAGQDGRADSGAPSDDGGRDGNGRGEKDEGGNGKKDKRDDPGPPIELAAAASVTVPATAPPSEDGSGGEVSFAAANLVDDVPTTCWRRPGDGTDDVLLLEFDERVRVTELGMINGYAKTQGRLDWYDGNRRVLRAEWVLDDGTTIEQELGDSRSLQTVPVDDVETESIRLRLARVSAPGSGAERRDFTAISELSVVGTTDDAG